MFAGQKFDAGFVFLMMHCNLILGIVDLRNATRCSFGARNERSRVADPAGLDPDPTPEKKPDPT